MKASYTDTKKLVVAAELHTKLRVRELYAALASMPNGAKITNVTYNEPWSTVTITLETDSGDVPT